MKLNEAKPVGANGKEGRWKGEGIKRFFPSITNYRALAEDVHARTPLIARRGLINGELFRNNNLPRRFPLALSLRA